MPSPVTVTTTTHNKEGKSIFRDNPAPKVFNDTTSLIYSTSSGNAVDLVDDNDILEHEARAVSVLIPREGSVVLLAEWAPGTESRLHRTQSIDVGVMTAGESKQYSTQVLLFEGQK